MQLLNGVILVVLIAGQFEILTAAVNRSHSFPVQSELLRQIRHVHDALLLVFPALLLGWVGFYNPSVLIGGSWSSLGPVWTVWLAVCALGSLSLVSCALRWQLRRRPSCLTGEVSQVTDIARLHDQDITGIGSFRLLTRIPRNEFLEVEFVEKTYEVPLAVPELRILHLSDFHFTGIPSVEFYRTALDLALKREYDLVVFTGDLMDDLSLVSWIPETLGRLRARLGCYYILGNHDWSAGDGGTRALLNAAGWIDVAGRAVEVPDTEGRLVIGGTEHPWMGRHPDFGPTPAAATRLLLSHTPDNLNWARSNNVQLMLAGHNHGGQVILPVIGPVYSPSWHGVRHSGGDYYHDPTLLHVSRGLGGQHPLRLNCRPEVATLILRDAAARTAR